MYKATAIVSTFQSSEYLEGCIVNLLNQTVRPEIVIIANEPDKQELEILEKYKNEVVFEIVERESLYKSWNRAIKKATGEFIFNANTDDRHSKYYVETMLNEIPDYDIVYADQYITAEVKPFEEIEDTTPTANYIKHNKSYVAFGCYFSSSPFWRKSLHNTYGYFREDFYSSGDWEMWCRLAETRIKKIDNILSAYYDNPKGIFNNSETKYKENEIIVKEYYNKYFHLNISACMIVKNEENNIRKCLSTIKDLCKEIIILDTGCSDNTVMFINEYIQKGYNIKLIRYSDYNVVEDINSFSKARNECLSYATGDWVLSIDGDEFLPYDAICKMIELLENTKYDYYLTRQFTPGGLTDFTYHTRLFKNNIGIYWTNNVHEVIDKSTKELNLTGARTNVYIYHTGYTNIETLKKKAQRNLRLHLQQLLDEPENQYVHVHLAMVYFYLQDNKQAVENAIISLCCKEINEETKARLCILLFIIFTQNKSYLTAINFLRQSIKLIPNQLYAHWTLADILIQTKRYEDAERELNFISEFINKKRTTELNNDMVLDVQTLNKKRKELNKWLQLQAQEQ
jgi:glycosyltransferase involved in cell wall biosynthesis